MALMKSVEHKHLASCTTRSWPCSLALRRHRSLNSEAIASRCQVLPCSPGPRSSPVVCGKETRKRTQHLQRAGRQHLSGSETSQNLHNDTEADVESLERSTTLWRIAAATNAAFAVSAKSSSTWTKQLAAGRFHFVAMYALEDTVQIWPAFSKSGG